MHWLALGRLARTSRCHRWCWTAWSNLNCKAFTRVSFAKYRPRPLADLLREALLPHYLARRLVMSVTDSSFSSSFDWSSLSRAHYLTLGILSQAWLVSTDFDAWLDYLVDFDWDSSVRSFGREPLLTVQRLFCFHNSFRPSFWYAQGLHHQGFVAL